MIGKGRGVGPITRVAHFHAHPFVSMPMVAPWPNGGGEIPGSVMYLGGMYGAMWDVCMVLGIRGVVHWGMGVCPYSASVLHAQALATWCALGP